MENKINIAELLKDCPKGMELDSIIYKDVTLMDVDCSCYPIQVQTPEGNMHLSKYGCMSLSEHAKCVIYPKGKTTWEGFVPPYKFKDGDILFVDCSDKGKYMSLQYIFILDTSNKYGKWQSYCYLRNDGFFKPKKVWLVPNECQPRFATKEEKEELFQAIKNNGFKWNAETKTLEKLVEPKFKVGDKIKWKGHDVSGRIEKIEDNVYHVDFGYDDGVVYVGFRIQDDYELVPDKFNINTLEPFDKVLVRDSDKDMWCASIFSHTWNDKYFCIGAWHNQCIPYEANKELLGTTNNPKEHGSN